jgi:hypothetical protein
MFDASLPVLAAWTNAAIFAVAGLVNLLAIGAVRETYMRWDIPALAYRTIGLIELVAAAFLAQPDLRVWGIVLVAPITFGAVVILLDHRHYFYAAAVSLMLVGFVPAMLAIPHARNIVHYAA